MKSKKTKIFFCLACLVAILFIASRYFYVGEKSGYQVEIVEVEPGNYGYKIKQHQKIIIYQQFIPAIEHKRNFSTAGDARKVGMLVARRIAAGEDFSVTRKDLDKLGISLSEQ